MQFKGFKLIFGDSIHHFLVDGKFTLEKQTNKITAILMLDNLDIIIRPMDNEEVILEIETLKFNCSKLLMLPEKRSIVLTVDSTDSAA